MSDSSEDTDRDAAIKRGKAKADKQSKARDKKGKGKKGKGGGEGAGPSVAGHPRAAASVRRAKGWGGIGGFAIAAYLGYQAGVPLHQIGERALAAGVAGYIVAWACAVTVWRHLLLAELRGRVEAARAAAPAARMVSTQREVDPTAEPAPEPAS